MLTFEHTVTTKAKLETIWELYSDITSWTAWDEGIEQASLDGPFVTDIADAGIEVRFTHRLQKALDGTSFTHAVSTS